MATILLAIGDQALKDACRAQLEAAGHAPLLLDRPLASLSLADKVKWDAACLDGSMLGRGALSVLKTNGAPAPVIGLGVDAPGLRAWIPLPLVAERLLDVIDEANDGGRTIGARSFSLDQVNRVVSTRTGEVTLTRTELRLLEVLHERQPADVPLVEVLSAVWGFTEGRGASELVRAHVRNLRAKLAQVGLVDVVRSRRGHGYAFVG
jgi:DNA-binding response OmpR family regulator